MSLASFLKGLAMGFSYRNICYDTVVQAQDAVCGNYSYVTSDATGKPVVSVCSGVTSTTVTQYVKVGTTAAVNYTQVMPAFPACGFTGGATLALDYFSLALGFLAVIWASKAIMNIFRGRHEVV